MIGYARQTGGGGWVRRLMQARKMTIALREHTIVPRTKKKNDSDAEFEKLEPQPYPPRTLIFDTETTVDENKFLTFGAYRICELIDGKYLCAEEGLFFPETLSSKQRAILEDYVDENFSQVETKSFPPRTKLALYSLAVWLEKILWKEIKRGSLVAGFNLKFDISRISRRNFTKSDKHDWAFFPWIYKNSKTGQVKGNMFRPRILTKAEFINLSYPPKDKNGKAMENWPRGRFLDLSETVWALRNRRWSLKKACEEFDTRDAYGEVRKLEGGGSGEVTSDEISYCRGDVRCTAALLNSCKVELASHPIDLKIDKAHSSASLAKSYLKAMNIRKPQDKFKIGGGRSEMAMNAYWGGRTETRIRKQEVPVTHTDFISNYATVNTLMRNWDVLTAKSVSFQDATTEVRRLIDVVALDDCFDRHLFAELGFFALVESDGHVFPCRGPYAPHGNSNIGLNYFRSAKPFWVTGPDLIVAKLLSENTARIRIIKAIRMVPHGKQEGMRKTSLRGVPVDPYKDDLFRICAEQRAILKKKHPKDPVGELFKVFANAGAYGIFVQLDEAEIPENGKIHAFLGKNKAVPVPVDKAERCGPWFFPTLAALITGGSHLFLAMLEKSVRDLGGQWAFTDTDSFCIVANEKGGLVPCPGGEHKLPDGREAIKALSWAQVDGIVEKFSSLNPYDSEAIPGSILEVKFNSNKVPLYCYSIASKRYGLYRYDATGNIVIIDAKAHRLGYLQSPVKKKDDFINEAWLWMLRGEFNIPGEPPKWLKHPAMMSETITTPNVIGSVKADWATPYNFLMRPKMSPWVLNADQHALSTITRFESDPERWIDLKCVDTRTGAQYEMTTDELGKGGDFFSHIVADTFEDVLRKYLKHPEHKSNAPDGNPCRKDTRGLLKRCLVEETGRDYVSKEIDRKIQKSGTNVSSFRQTRYNKTVEEKSCATKLSIRECRELRARVRKLGYRKIEKETGVRNEVIGKALSGGIIRKKTRDKLLE